MNPNVFDDDRHLCLRCHATIYGLDSYVNHRRAGCLSVSSTTTVALESQFPTSAHVYLSESRTERVNENLDPLWDTELRADDFFSVLELQRLQSSPSESRKRLRSEARQFMDPHLSITELWYDTIEHDELLEEFNDNELYQRLELSPLLPSKYLRNSPDLRARTQVDNQNTVELPNTQNGVRFTPDRITAPFTGPSRTQKFRGKWMPGEQKDLVIHEEAASYTCHPCGRSSSTQSSYEKHLLSDDHINNVGKRPELGENQRKSPRKSNTDFAHIQCSLRKPRKGDLVCPICKARVAKHLFGKHLLSRYHYEFGRRKPSANAKLILKNLEKVVKECAYQCGLCKFFCNTDTDFLRHWRSIDHAKKDAETPGIYVCSACSYEATYGEFSEHLMSRGHEERSSIVFQCVPIVVRKRQLIFCKFCDETFDLRVKLKKHVRRVHNSTNGSALKGRDSRNYGELQSRDLSDDDDDSGLMGDVRQNLFACPACHLDYSDYDLLAEHIKDEHKDYFACTECQFLTLQPAKLRRHMQEVHEVHPGFQCWICKINFKTKEEADHHRESREHREKAASLKKGAVILKKCPHCRQIFRDISSLRQHILDLHSGELSKCERCGEAFPFKQDLGPHRKICKGTPSVPSNGCEVDLSEDVESNENSFECNGMPMFACDLCHIAFSSRAEERFHVIICHKGPTSSRSVITGDGPSQLQDLYSCTDCQLVLPKDSLKRHLCVHSGDRMFKCKYCQRRLKTHALLEAHVSTHNTYHCSTPGCSYVTVHHSSLSRHMEKHQAELKYPCDECGKQFKTQTSLRSHAVLHQSTKKIFVCDQCEYSTARKGTLNRHLSYVHSVGAPVFCESCGFQAKNKHHLKRHQKSSH